MSHFILYKIPLQKNWIDSVGVKFITKLEQLMVTMFLFYSGYGVMESIKRKGDDYIKSFPKKRILTTLINLFINSSISSLVLYFPKLILIGL